jgi:hypothetical protein
MQAVKNNYWAARNQDAAATLTRVDAMTSRVMIAAISHKLYQWKLR